MFKDKDKQREANRQAMERYREAEGRRKGITKEQGITVSLKARQEGITNDSTASGITALGITEKIAEVKRRTPLTNKPERTAQGNIRVSKPGDDDYVPMCETTRAFVDGRDKRPESGKRGLDIKCFEDLPMDVQASIDRLSVVDGKMDQTIKANRTAIAVNYQHQFPDRFHSTGVT